MAGTVEPNATANISAYSAVASNVSIVELVRGGLVATPFNISVQGGRLYSVTGAVLDIFLRTGENNLTFNKAGWYNLTFAVNRTTGENATASASGAYDGLANITARNILTNASISNFTANITQADYAYFASGSTTNGTRFISFLKNLNYSLEADALGFTPGNLSPSNFTNTTPKYRFDLYTQNSVTINFYDQLSSARIYGNTSVSFVSTNASYTLYGNGSLYEDLLDPGTWTLTITAPGYDAATYYVTVANDSTQTLDAYLLNASLSQDTVFYLRDTDGNNIIGGTITIQDLVNGSFVTFGQKLTDFVGAAYFRLRYAHSYQGIFEAPGYATKTAIFEVLADTYTIRLSANNTQNYTSYAEEFAYVTTPDAVTANITSFTITTSSPDGRLEWFAVTTTYNGTTGTANVSGSPSGGTANRTINLSGANRATITVLYRVKSVGIDAPLEIARSFYVYSFTPGNYTLADFGAKYGSGPDDLGGPVKSVLVVVAAVVVALLLGAALGVSGGSVGAAAVMILGGWFGWMNWSIVILSAGALLLTAFAGGRK